TVGKLEDITFIESTLFSVSRDARLCAWDLTSERLIRGSHLDFPARRVLGKHLEFPPRCLIPWGDAYPSGTLLVACCDYVAWISIEWVYPPPSRQSPVPKPMEFDWDLILTAKKTLQPKKPLSNSTESLVSDIIKRKSEN
ncbi:unnamed protein product, partial [Cyprideis torosa]